MYLRHRGPGALKKNERGTRNFNSYAEFLSFSVLRDGALCQGSYCGLLYSQGWRGECSVGRHGNQETVGAGGKAGVSPVQKAMGLQDVREGSFGGAAKDPRHPTLLQARGRIIETGDCKAL